MLPPQFFFYIGYFSLLAVIYLVRGLYVFGSYYREKKALQKAEAEAAEDPATELNQTEDHTAATPPKA